MLLQLARRSKCFPYQNMEHTQRARLKGFVCVTDVVEQCDRHETKTIKRREKNTKRNETICNRRVDRSKSVESTYVQLKLFCLSHLDLIEI